MLLLLLLQLRRPLQLHTRRIRQRQRPHDAPGAHRRPPPTTANTTPLDPTHANPTDTTSAPTPRSRPRPRSSWTGRDRLAPCLPHVELQVPHHRTEGSIPAHLLLLLLLVLVMLILLWWRRRRWGREPHPHRLMTNTISTKLTER